MAIKIAGTEVINDNRELVLAKLTEINTSIADTAVDIFVYDTRKDSDGGAWRKRTQHTSWYNETLNTATRGSRKEFPSVAVIVATSNPDKITVYDGDDPDLPMWIVLDDYDYLMRRDVECVTALNGVIATGTRDNTATPDGFRGLVVSNFVSDTSTYYQNSSAFVASTGIGQRSTFDISTDISYYLPATIIHPDHNDVAMTVLPNAPIDASSGLPTPTIAVATDGGVSVIKDDGTVANMARGSNETGTVAFDDNYDLIFSWGTSADGHRHITRLSAPWVSFNDSITWTNNYFVPNAAGGTAGVAKVGNSGRHFGIDYDASSGGNTDDRLLTVVASNGQVDMSNYTTSTYNTGWMNGDIKLATLSDTYATNVTGSELVTNGTFDTDSDWTKASGATISGGEAVFTSVASATNAFTQNITLVSGKVYTVSFEITSISAGAIGIFIPTDVGGPVYESSAGSYSVTFTATATSRDLSLRTSGTTTATVDNISVRLAEEDRSVNGNGLQVFGTVTKSAVDEV